MTASVVAITELTDVAEARRRAADLGRAGGLDEAAAGRLAIAVTEVATNLLKHASGGEVFVGMAGTAQRRGVQVIGIDRGGGMTNVDASLVDGYSTAGTAGTGLGAIRRVSDSFDLYTARTGTVVAACVFPSAGRPPAVPPAGAVCVPAPGERESGDAWAIWSAGGLTSVFVVDGLGHGRDAATAARVAVDMFQRHAERAAPDIVALVHDAMKKTRGGAIALAELDERSGTMRYCAVGNISAVVARPNGDEQHCITLPGIAGHAMRRVQTFTYEWPRGSLLIMHTDGIGTHWSLAKYPGLMQRRPDVVAGVLYRDHRRGSDDATAVVTRHGEVA